jgi:urease accessory protein
VTTWEARLALDYRPEAGRTVLAREHRGPLQVQKALYPEGPQLAHTLIIHPPGGIAGGDALTLAATVRPQAQALITTPGATKWYKANGRQATQHIGLDVAGGLEWLPQEAIVFDHAVVRSAIDIRLHGDAAMLGWDIVALGRSAAGESFTEGCYAQTIRLHDDARLQWVERTRIAGGDALLDSPIGLAGRTAFGCLWAAGPHWRDADIESLRERLPEHAAPITRVAPRLLIARALAHTAPAVRAALTAVWRELRPLVFEGRAAQMPRIWAT